MCGKICQAIEASFFYIKNTNNNNNNKLPASESCTKQTLEKIKKKKNLKDCWDYTGMFDFLYPRKGENRKRNMSMQKFA